MTISLVGLLILLVIAAVCGAIGRAIAGGTHGGCLISIALGFIGALLGSWLATRGTAMQHGQAGEAVA